ncbi:3-oxoacyl-reductase [Phyllosticta citrichinensis]|uniref:3-oxoacyl-reductase n=1 Tax=Phyllosticta citrichinensis TaxID=1130410 RepID=A0ABR1XHX3_9PEZI
MGCNIAAHYNANVEAAETLVKSLQRKGVRAEAFQADLNDYEEVRKLHQSVVSTFGHPSILFNNAGTTLSQHGLKSASDVSIEDFEKTWRSNCGSAFLLTQLCAPAMETSKWGCIIFCSSGAAFNGGVVGPHYASSKSALYGLIHWLAGAYSQSGITVNGVAPALIQDTAMLPGSNEELAKKIPIGRLGKPEEVAETVIWMVKTG